MSSQVLKTAPRRRIAPSHQMSLDLLDDDGSKFTVRLRLSFDMNVIVLIEEKTGLGVVNGEAWEYIAEKLGGAKRRAGREYSAHPAISHLVSTMLWAAALPHHGDEYSGDDGLVIIRSYMDFGNFVKVATELEKAYVATIPEEQKKALEKSAENGGDLPLVDANQPTGSASGRSPATSESPTKSSAA